MTAWLITMACSGVFVAALAGLWLFARPDPAESDSNETADPTPNETANGAADDSQAGDAGPGPPGADSSKGTSQGAAA